MGDSFIDPAVLAEILNDPSQTEILEVLVSLFCFTVINFWFLKNIFYQTLRLQFALFMLAAQ